jgi:flavoprotein
MDYIILRNNAQFSASLWNLRINDSVLGTDGYFHPVYSYPQLAVHFPKPQPTVSDIVNVFATSVLICVGIATVAGVVEMLLTPTYNRKSLAQSTKNYIRERDGEICFYCDGYAPKGHIDHRISRYNGGSNEFHNLTWACASCNCSKGALNDDEFISLI